VRKNRLIRIKIAIAPMGQWLTSFRAPLAVSCAKGTGLRDPDCSMKAVLCAAGYGEWFDFAKNTFRR
jgi:hypothetical protein